VASILILIRAGGFRNFVSSLAASGLGASVELKILCAHCGNISDQLPSLFARCAQCVVFAALGALPFN
jgi:hypothetical protein